MEAHTLQKIERADAVRNLRRCADVSGCSVEALSNGSAYRLRTAGGHGVFVVREYGPELWVQAAEGEASEDLTEAGLQIIEMMAIARNCTTVAFQTRRPGLLRKAQRLGFEPEPMVLRKKVQ